MYSPELVVAVLIFRVARVVYIKYNGEMEILSLVLGWAEIPNNLTLICFCKYSFSKFQKIQYMLFQNFDLTQR